jgi:hypothetical protein
MSKATRAYNRTAPAWRAFSFIAELLAVATLIGGGAVLTALATLA